MIDLAAGVCHVGSVESMDLDEFSLSFALNVRANAVLARSALPALRRAGGGSLLFTASGASVMVAKGSLPYIVSKSALLTMTRQAFLEKVPELVPLHRMGTVEEFGGIVRFILSQEARFMTGQALVIDGGESLIKGSSH
jgi:Dehydrogenases with different specificities (related to short-chain alcohol dehydrogenases)